MATQRTTDEADIRQHIDTLVAAIRAMDLERMMASFAADLVSFDIEPPLRHVGIDAKRRNWARVFAAYERPLGYEIRDLAVTVGHNAAFGHSLNRISGVLKDGQTNASWVRWTVCLRKIEGRWLITHDQVSVPVDFASGKALLTLEP